MLRARLKNGTDLRVTNRALESILGALVRLTCVMALIFLLSALSIAHLYPEIGRQILQSIITILIP